MVQKCKKAFSLWEDGKCTFSVTSSHHTHPTTHTVDCFESGEEFNLLQGRLNRDGMGRERREGGEGGGTKINDIGLCKERK